MACPAAFHHLREKADVELIDTHLLVMIAVVLLASAWALVAAAITAGILIMAVSVLGTVQGIRRSLVGRRSFENPFGQRGTRR